MCLEAAKVVVRFRVQESDLLRKLISEKVRDGLISEDETTRVMAVKMIEYAEYPEQEALIKEGLANTDPAVNLLAASLIFLIAQQNELRQLVLDRARKGLASENKDQWIYGARMAQYTSDDDKAKLDIVIKQDLAKMLTEKLVEPPLYSYTDIDEERFTRRAFEKTGSDTTLLGGNFKNRLIIRHIEPEAFLAWQKLFEAFDSWKKAGFDYIPIEPINSFRFNAKTGNVDVFTGVLDINLEQWLATGGNFSQELREQKSKIDKVLAEKNVTHRDFANKNFCLRFYRDSQGKIDFSRQPQIYLIDLDHASIDN